MILRRIARPLLASIFISDGIRALRDPSAEIEAFPQAEERLEELAAQVPYLPASATALVRAVGVAKIGAGVALALGFAPRVAAGTLAALQIPTMVMRHPIWAVSGGERSEHLSGLLRNGAVLGGLLLASADTEGKPSLAWRLEAARAKGTKSAKKAGRRARRKVEKAVEAVAEQAESLVE